MMRLKSSTPKILVIGDLMIDHYLWGKCERISPEAPVQVVDINNEEQLLGGAGNVMNNLLDFGASVGAISVVGDDENGAWIEERLRNRGIKNEMLLKQSDRKTSKKSRVIASHQQIVRIDKESKEDISHESEETIAKAFEAVVHTYDLVLLSDYGKGVLTPTLTQKLIQISKAHNKSVFVDPKGKDYSKYKGASLITPNKKEAMEATSKSINSLESLKEVGFYLKESLHLDSAIITLSEDGMAIFEEQMHKIDTVAKEVFDVTGAGDTVLAMLGFAYASGYSLKESAHYANVSAGIVVGKVGCATAKLEEIERFERYFHSDELIKSFEQIEHIARALEDKKIVFTNGCFDILHLGHVKYLQEAKSFGDVLIVGVNSDASVKRLKGESRPINGEYDRAYLLSALKSVDYVVIFNEDTPYELIKRVQPDVLVKGGDYEDKEVVGSDIAKEVRLVQFVDGKSTTCIISKIEENSR